MDAEDVAAYRGHDTAREINARVGPQRNESGRALRLVATRVKPQHHPMKAGVETALANCGSITIS